MYDKNQSLDKIAQYSGHLSGKLERLKDDLDYDLISKSFLHAINNGGLEELEYIRPEGQSFNPRPARVALILIESGLNLSSHLLSAACISTASNLEEAFDVKSFMIASEAIELSKGVFEKYDSQSLNLAYALHLDRARHFHLSKNYNNLNSNEQFCSLTKKLLSYSEQANPFLSNLLTHWLTRHEKKSKMLFLRNQ